MDYKKCCELLKPLYGKNNDYGLFREDLTDAEKSNLERNLDGGACFHWKGVIPFNGYDFYTTNETAFQNALLSEGKKAAVLKIWDDETYGERLTEDQKKQLLLTKDQKQRIVDYCKQLYETGTPESTYVADSIMSIGLRHPVYKKYFEDNRKLGPDHFPKLDYQKENDNTSYLGWGAGGAAAGVAAGKIAGLSSIFGLPGLAAAGIGAGVVAGGKCAYDYFQKDLKNATYTEKNGPALLKQVQDELDGKTLQKQQENINTQSRENQQEIVKINEERKRQEEQRKIEEQRKNEERRKEEQRKKEEEQREKEEDQRKKEEERRKNEERRKEEQRKKEEEEREKEKDSTQTKDIQLKNIDFSQKDVNQSLTVKGKKGQVTTQPTNVQNLNQNLDAIRQKITEETQNSTNAPVTVDASQLDNNKSLQTAIAAKEQGSWWSRNWDILALIAGGLGALGIGAWLVKRQKNKTKEAQAEASALTNQVSSLNSKVSSLTEALNTQSNQPATNTETNSNTGTGNGSTLGNSGSSVPNDSSTDSSSVDKGRPVKIVIKGKTSSEME